MLMLKKEAKCLCLYVAPISLEQKKNISLHIFHSYLSVLNPDITSLSTNLQNIQEKFHWKALKKISLSVKKLSELPSGFRSPSDSLTFHWRWSRSWQIPDISLYFLINNLYQQQLAQITVQQIPYCVIFSLSTFQPPTIHLGPLLTPCCLETWPDTCLPEPTSWRSGDMPVH